MKIIKKIIQICSAVAVAGALSLSASAENTQAVSRSLTVSAKSAVLINADTGEVIFEKNADEPRAVASTTKVMTAYIALDYALKNGCLDEPFTVDDRAVGVEGTSMYLAKGDVVTLRDLCYGMLLPSGNDAANAVAYRVSGDVNAFSDVMNEYAANLSMTSTHFVTPSGLDANGHLSTAADMAKLTRAALLIPEFREMCSSQVKQIKFTDANGAVKLRTLHNNNKLLRNYAGCIGVKTGFTDAARRCLISAAVRGTDGSDAKPVTLIAVTLSAGGDWNDHTRMLNYGFSVVLPRELPLPAQLLRSVVLETGDDVVFSPAGEFKACLSDEEAARVEYRICKLPYINAGVAAGEYAGYAEALYDGNVIARVNLQTAEEYPVRTENLGILSKTLDFFLRLAV